MFYYQRLKAYLHATKFDINDGLGNSSFLLNLNNLSFDSFIFFTKKVSLKVNVLKIDVKKRFKSKLKKNSIF